MPCAAPPAGRPWENADRREAPVRDRPDACATTAIRRFGLSARAAIALAHRAAAGQDAAAAR